VVRAQERLVVQPAGVVTWDEMVAADARVPRSPAAPARLVPRMPAPPPREVGRLALWATPTTPVSPETGPGAAGPAIIDNFAALGDNNTAIPPDTMGAAGPSHLMTMLNTQVRIQTKTGGVISTVSTPTFWTSGTGLSGGPFDPHVVFDSISGRWIATVFANGDSPTSKVWVAVSTTNDPTGSWTFFQLVSDASSTTWADYPGLGVNSKWIAITANMFTLTGGVAGSKMWVIDKSTALAGGPLSVTIFPTLFDYESSFGTYGFTLKPAVTYSAAEPTLFIVDNTGFTSSGTPLIRLSRITGTGPAPVWSVQPASTFAGTGLFPVAHDFEYTEIDAPQSGTAALIDAGDARASDSVYRNGRLWFAHSGTLPNGAPTRNAVFWYQLNPAAMPSPIVQSGVLDGGGSVHHFFPSMAANAANDALIGFSRSSPGIFVQAVWASRFAADAPGTMTSGPSVLKLGEDSYVKTFGGPDVRWGDYSATSVDPTDGLTFWTIQEYAETDVGGTPNDDRWGTWWGTTGPLAATTTTLPASTTTTATSPTTTTTTIAAAIGHLKCYNTRDSRARTAYTLDLIAGVGGFPSELGCRLKLGSKKICVEVSKQNVSPPAPGGGPAIPPNTASVFLSYRVNCPRLTVAPVALTDQFGTGSFIVGGVSELLVPALPGPANDHFECYKARDARPRAAYTMNLIAGVAGFTNETGCALRLGARRICVQVTKQNVAPAPPGGGPGPGPSSGATLISYRLKCPSGIVTAGGFTDQFGPGTFTPRTPKALLVPAQ
jgi:hypothetical protein